MNAAGRETGGKGQLIPKEPVSRKDLVKLRLIHETNPEKYFPALFDLDRDGAVQITGAHRYSVVKEWIRAWKKDRAPLGPRSRNAFGDLGFRLSMAGVRDEVIVMGFAPWDWRLLIYRGLARHNRILYHTSWHDWGLDRTPRQPRPAAFRAWMRDRWIAFLRHPNVETIAVTSVVASAVRDVAGVDATVIPHAVPQVFFRAGATKVSRLKGPLKLLYVGEVSEKKGISVLLKVMQTLAGKGVTLTVVGNGPLADKVRRAEQDTHGVIRFLGPVYDREKLAGIMADHDVLMLLSQKTPTWEELFGIVVVEALSAGLAVVASDHVGPSGILAPVEGAGLFPQDDVAGVTALLSAMAKDRGRLKELYNRQAPVAAKYGIQSVAKRWQGKIDQ